MKQLAILMIFIFTIVTTTVGCGGKNVVNPDYLAYTQALQAQFLASKEPLVSIEVDTDGKIAGVIVNQPMRNIVVQQKAPHPGWGVFSGVVRMCGVVGSIWATGDAISGIIEAGSGTNTYINSANNNSENSGSIDSAYTVNDIVTTTTESAAVE